ncbi:uncharacterized protein BO97DRAFT_60979 [Aspergillus homomorphus CBS 101889]|uniref:Uncharacterized protein n=1 Tax=Aspergillus homomorphus (strain CBS 101889) TaxID=1450537 RepID=A0A395HWI1_ASPHC|nr:hypothetical protein BO97DRAFT_60979 [Aspergillus homomorphus CBS 101889]RAL12157.1 hypothetical protein BO97DRAFT_60979 [Aspergillus homomorphus CBS 101889]
MRWLPPLSCLSFGTNHEYLFPAFPSLHLPLALIFNSSAPLCPVSTQNLDLVVLVRFLNQLTIILSIHRFPNPYLALFFRSHAPLPT